MEFFSTRKLTTSNVISSITADFQNATIEFTLANGDGETFSIGECDTFFIDGTEYMLVGINHPQYPGLAVITTVEDESYIISPIELARFGEWL